MRINKFALMVAFVIASLLFFEVIANADEANQSTKLTFSNPVEIPGQFLPAGTYLFKLADQNDLNLVRIYSADGSRLVATLETIPTERAKATEETVVTFAKQQDGRPDALMSWYYPGTTTGHEFVYPVQEDQQLAQDRQLTLVGKETAEAGD